MAKKKAIKLDPSKMIYHNMEFIDSDVGRPIRILAEFMGPYQIFAQEGVKNTIVFFDRVFLVSCVGYPPAAECAPGACGHLSPASSSAYRTVAMASFA